MTAVVAIVGRPNVGKSTLFNKLIGKRRAIESEVSGTTRDRIYSSKRVQGYDIMFVDTGGLESETENELIESNVQEQSKIAIEGADVIVFVVDVRADMTADDFHVAELLRKSKKHVILVANKCDNPSLEENRYNFYELGFGDPVPVTAIHSYGIDELEDRVIAELKALKIPESEEIEDEADRIKITFLGRPNVGKSTMVNALFGKKIVITSEIPGTTRDSTEIPFDYKDHKFTLVDTAGIRRRGKLERGIEKFSVLRSLSSIDLSDICVLILDFDEGITNQDCHVSEYILEEKKGLIVMVNKIDTLSGADRERRENEFIYDLKEKMAYIPWAPLVFTSALERKNIFQVLELAAEISAQRRKVVAQEDLNIWLDAALKKFPPKGTRGKRRFDVVSVEQVESNPPCFVFYCHWPEIMHFSYGRYLENELRAAFGFTGTAVRMIFRKPGDRGGRRKSS